MASGSSTSGRIRLPNVPPSSFREVFEAFESVETRRDLVELCRHVARHADPTVLALLRREAWKQTRFVHPKEYRDEILGSLFESLVRRINEMKETDPKNVPDEPIEGYEEFLEIVHEYAEDPDYDSPLLLLYEASAAAFAVFHLEEPVHPPGTRFPGVGRVREVDGKYLCPIKKRREGQPGSFCTVCPAEPG